MGANFFLVFGKTTLLKFRKDLTLINKNLKTPAIGGNKHEFLHLLLEFRKNLFRQPDGLGFVVSHRTVNNLNFHRLPPGKKSSEESVKLKGNLVNRKKGY